MRVVRFSLCASPAASEERRLFPALPALCALVGTDDQTWESGAVPLHGRGSHLLSSTSFSPFWSRGRSYMKELAFLRWWELGDKVGGRTAAGPSPGNTEFFDSCDTGEMKVR